MAKLQTSQDVCAGLVLRFCLPPPHHSDLPEVNHPHWFLLGWGGMSVLGFGSLCAWIWPLRYGVHECSDMGGALSGCLGARVRVYGAVPEHGDSPRLSLEVCV